jgi:hypothetical protein
MRGNHLPKKVMILPLRAHFSLILKQLRQQQISFVRLTNLVKVVSAKFTRVYFLVEYKLQ